VNSTVGFCMNFTEKKLKNDGFHCKNTKLLLMSKFYLSTNIIMQKMMSVNLKSNIVFAFWMTPTEAKKKCINKIEPLNLIGNQVNLCNYLTSQIFIFI
jgi:hypothetical protein